jgi:uncharacterized OB-fold protein
MMTTPLSRPLPRFPEPDTEPYWRATHDHRLLYRVDPATGEVVSTTRRAGDAQGGEWREAAGTGTVYSFTVIRQHGQPYFRSRVPYVVGFIDLDEGARLLAEIAADPATVRIGARVRVAWEDHEEVSVPVFNPDDDLS